MQWRIMVFTLCKQALGEVAGAKRSVLCDALVLLQQRWMRSRERLGALLSIATAWSERPQ